MGRNRKVECRICLKTMTSDHLERHMKTHEKKSNGIDEGGSFVNGYVVRWENINRLNVKFV